MEKSNAKGVTRCLRTLQKRIQRAHIVYRKKYHYKKTPVAILLACAYAGSSIAYGARQHSSTYTIAFFFLYSGFVIWTEYYTLNFRSTLIVPWTAYIMATRCHITKICLILFLSKFCHSFAVNNNNTNLFRRKRCQSFSFIKWYFERDNLSMENFIFQVAFIIFDCRTPNRMVRRHCSHCRSIEKWSSESKMDWTHLRVVSTAR